MSLQDCRHLGTTLLEPLLLPVPSLARGRCAGAAVPVLVLPPRPHVCCQTQRTPPRPCRQSLEAVQENPFPPQRLGSSVLFFFPRRLQSPLYSPVAEPRCWTRLYRRRRVRCHHLAVPADGCGVGTSPPAERAGFSRGCAGAGGLWPPPCRASLPTSQLLVQGAERGGTRGFFNTPPHAAAPGISLPAGGSPAPRGGVTSCPLCRRTVTHAVMLWGAPGARGRAPLRENELAEDSGSGFVALSLAGGSLWSWRHQEGT